MRTRSRSRTASCSDRRGKDAVAAPGPERFQQLDEYRVEREWLRLEGTPQRRLFREIRERFLARHHVDGGWVAELGSGPGRFSRWVGGEASRRLLVDLSLEMLRETRRTSQGWDVSGSVRTARADARRTPFKRGQFHEVVLLGNVVGFAGSRGEELLREALDLLEPGGTAVVEIAPSTGERSAYLHRLPPGAVARLLRAPRPLVARRVLGEPFLPNTPAKRTSAGFRRWSVDQFRTLAEECGAETIDTLAVAPALGLEPLRLSEVEKDPVAWQRLVALEEELGRDATRWRRAAAVLVALRRPTDPLRNHDN